MCKKYCYSTGVGQGYKLYGSRRCAFVVTHPYMSQFSGLLVGGICKCQERFFLAAAAHMLVSWFGKVESPCRMTFRYLRPPQPHCKLLLFTSYSLWFIRTDLFYICDRYSKLKLTGRETLLNEQMQKTYYIIFILKFNKLLMQLFVPK